MVADILADLERRDLLGLVQAIAAEHHTTAEDLVSRNRYREAVRARQAVWYALRVYSEGEWSYPSIGRLFRVDHSTVIHGVAAHARRLVEREAVAAE